MESLRVGMAEFKVANLPTILTSIGLGSCVAVVLYDDFKKIGGLAHIMLPKEKEANDTSNPAKFADSAIELMLKEMEKKGANKKNIKAKIFGGANMFPNIYHNPLTKVGERNIIAVREELKKRKIRIVAEDVGGNIGRTVIFDTSNGKVIVKNAKGEEKVY
jgi:chemotaxis protein CheD